MFDLLISYTLCRASGYSHRSASIGITKATGIVVATALETFTNIRACKYWQSDLWFCLSPLRFQVCGRVVVSVVPPSSSSPVGILQSGIEFYFHHSLIYLFLNQSFLHCCCMRSPVNLVVQ